MNQTLTLNDGTVLAPAHATLAGGVLWVYVDGSPEIGEVFELLNDPEKTARIVADEFGTNREYSGYTDLFCIRREDYGQVNAGLKYGE